MDVSRTLILIGLAIGAVGLAWPLITRLGLGHLPGDIVVRRGNFSFYFPLVTCLMVSAVVTLLLWVFRR